MAREITVLLKKEEAETPSTGGRVLSFLNELITSPLFVFVFGASLGTVYPTIQEWLTPSSELELRQAEDRARADAALIAPFIDNLDASKPGQFEAAAAALHALEQAADAADGAKRPMFVAVNGAIDAVARQLWPPTNKTALNPEVNKEIETTAVTQSAPTTPEAAPTLFALKQDTVVYIQVDKDDAKGQELAARTQQALRKESVLAPGIEKLPSRNIPSRTQVRYFVDGDKGKADQLAALVATITGKEVLVAQPKLGAKPGTLEIWFAVQ